MGRVIGIDLGTTNSLVSVYENGKSILIPNAFNEYLTPSVVSIDKNQTVYVGKVAKERLVTHPDDTQAVFKRFMGTKKVFTLAGHEYSPEDLSAFVLRKLKEDAESYLKEPVETAVISVPAYFNDMGRAATKRAGQLAGLKVERILNEPSAAALAYRSMKGIDNGRLMVFDFGGGTLDVSMVECSENLVEIESVAGDNHLGGTDFDEVIADYFLRKNKIDRNTLNDKQYEIILKFAEKVKQELSKAEEVNLEVVLDGIAYSFYLSRKILIDISNELLGRVLIPVRKALNTKQQNGYFERPVNGIVMVGGSCKMPIVQMYLSYVLKRKDIEVIDPDFMIAYGVGIYAGKIESGSSFDDVMLTDVCPFSLGVNVRNELDPSKSLFSPVIERNSPLPICRSETFYQVSPEQKYVTFSVYQGDSYYAKDNIWLGKMSMDIPKTTNSPDEYRLEAFIVKFAYDISGILMVEVTTASTGEKKELTITSDGIALSDEEISEKIKILQTMSLNPRENEQNDAILSRVERIYEESSGSVRKQVMNMADYFTYLMQKGDIYRLESARRRMTSFLDYTEEQMGFNANTDDLVDDFSKWYTSGDEEEEADQTDFGNWYNDHLTS